MNVRRELFAVGILSFICATGVYAGESAEATGFRLDAPLQNDAEIVVPYRKNIAAELTQHTLYPGLLPLYWNQGTESLKVRVPRELLGQKLVLHHATENGVPMLGHFRGAYNASSIVWWRRRGPKLELVKQPHTLYFEAGSPLTRAADANLSPAVLWSLGIEIEDTDSGDLLAEIGPVLRSEKLMRLRPPKALIEKKKMMIGAVNAGSSHILAARNFPDNTDIVVELNYEAGDADKKISMEQADPRHLLVQYQVSFVRVPQHHDGFEPRPADQRIGFFQTIGYDMTALDPRPWRDFIYRWDLQPEPVTGGGYQAARPIVWWIENTTPEKIRPVIRDAVLQWNRAFESVGITGAVQVKVQPDDAEWEAGDLRYNTIRWVSSLRPPFGGYGPALVDPRTGEILGADITLEYSYLYKRTRAWEEFGQGNADVFDCQAGPFIAMQRQLSEEMMGVPGTDASTAVSPALESALYYLLMHEVGHTLGLTHNFKGSTWLTMQEIASGDSKALQGSVMDYPSPNFTHKYGGKPERLFTRDLGPYDLWAIDYGYSPSVSDAVGERERLLGIAARSTAPGHAYANDSDDMREPGKGVDPRAQIFDYSSDPLSWAEDRFALYDDFLTKLVQDASTRPAGEVRDWIKVLRTAYDHNSLIVAQYTNGAYVERHDPALADKPVLQPTPVTTAARALQILKNHALPMRFFRALQELLPYLAPERRGFTGTGPGTVYPVENMAHTMNKRLFATLLHPQALRRIEGLRPLRESKDWSAPTLMTELQAAIFDTSLPALDGPAMWLQQDWVAALLQLYTRPASDKIPATVRGHTRILLEELSRAWPYPLRANATQRGHYKAIQIQIQQALSK